MLEKIQKLGEKQRIFYLWLGVLALVYLLIVAVGIIGTGFQAVAGEKAQNLFTFATNPFAGLIVGILSTAVIQSSSTVTSIIVGLVAGGLPVSLAIPMVMGSNVGTTITNMLVSLGHIGVKEEFRRAFAAATIHDFFNLLCVLIFFPLEMGTHFLEKITAYLAQFLVGNTAIGLKDFNPIQIAIQPGINFVIKITEIFPKPLANLSLIVIGVTLIFVAIFFLGQLLKQLMAGQSQQLLRSAIGRSPIAGIFSGTLVTMLVQSSSTTTSLIVPLAGTDLLTLEEVYPFTLGANIGTCITALLAAIAVPDNPIAALQIALVHLLFNVFGVCLIYGIPWLRKIPIIGAQTLANVASERKYLAFIYILGTFFLIPILLLGLTSFELTSYF